MSSCVMVGLHVLRLKWCCYFALFSEHKRRVRCTLCAFDRHCNGHDKAREHIPAGCIHLLVFRMWGHWCRQAELASEVRRVLYMCGEDASPRPRSCHTSLRRRRRFFRHTSTRSFLRIQLAFSTIGRHCRHTSWAQIKWLPVTLITSFNLSFILGYRCCCCDCAHQCGEDQLCHTFGQQNPWATNQRTIAYNQAKYDNSVLPARAKLPVQVCVWGNGSGWYTCSPMHNMYLSW